MIYIKKDSLICLRRLVVGKFKGKAVKLTRPIGYTIGAIVITALLLTILNLTLSQPHSGGHALLAIVIDILLTGGLVVAVWCFPVNAWKAWWKQDPKILWQ